MGFKLLVQNVVYVVFSANQMQNSKIFPRKLRALIGLSWKFWPEGITLVWSLRQPLEYALKSALNLEQRKPRKREPQVFSYTEPVYSHNG